MTTPLSDLQVLLLDLLSETRAVDEAALARCTPADWDSILCMTGQHRIGALLHWRLQHERKGISVPDVVKAKLAAAFRGAAVRSLLLQQSLTLCHKTLTAAGIRHVALKGAYLAYHVYPHPALRHLNDLDILVSEAEVLDAYQALLDEGWERTSESPGDPRSCLETRKHLPALCLPSTDIRLEVHARITPPGMQSAPLETTLWDRLVEETMAGQTLEFLSPTDLLLHLVEHASYDHMFSNGPLLLSDVHYLLKHRSIDWPLFWDLAEACGWTRGCRLVLGMVERYADVPSIPYPAPLGAEEREALDQHVAAASLTMLRDIDVLRNVLADFRLKHGGTFAERLGFMRRKILPSRTVISARYPVAHNSILIAGWYVVDWLRLAARRTPQYLSSQFDRRAMTESRQIARIQQWLHAQPKGPGAEGRSS